jgi:hypothetical protein
MDVPEFLTPVGLAWRIRRETLLDDLSWLLEASASDSSRRQLIDGGVLVLVAGFQAAMRSLLALGSRGIGDAIGGDLGLIVQRALTADSRLARGNASADNLRTDFARIGIDVWDLDYGVGIEGWVRRGWLDDVNEVRNAIAHGTPPGAALGVIDFERIREFAVSLDAVVVVVERAVVALIERATRSRDHGHEAM